MNEALLQCIEDYQNEAAGPCVNLVLVDNLSVIVNYCLQALRKAEVDHCLVSDALKAENASLRSQVNAFKETEASLQELVRATVDKASKQVQAKDLQLAELTAAINARANASETKLRDFSRELQTLQADLDQARREKQLLADTQSEILAKRLEEAETRTLKASSQSSRLAEQLEELRLEHSQLMSEKTSAIHELSRKIKQLESQTEASPRQDTFILMAIKDYFEGMQSCFASEQTAHKKAMHCMEQLAEVQAELNRTRLAEQSQRFKLTEEFEAKQRVLKSQLQSHSNQIAELEKVCQLQGSKLAMLKTVAPPPPQEDAPEAEVQAAEGKDDNFAHDLLENHLEIQFELIDTQRQSIEALRQEIDSQLELISKLKYDVVAKEDDNDMLLQVVNATLEFTKKMRPSLKNVFGAMHNPELKAKVEQLLTKHRVPFT
jgi:DNA repair exonuclease SbcCD ATPase subunit